MQRNGEEKRKREKRKRKREMKEERRKERGKITKSCDKYIYFFILKGISPRLFQIAQTRVKGEVLGDGCVTSW